MQLCKSALCTLLACPVSATANAGSSFTIDSWSLSAGAHGPFPYFSSVVFETVANPYTDHGQVTERDSSASTSFDFWWTDQYGSFLIQSSVHCVSQNVPPFPGGGASELCGADGSMRFTASADLLFSVDAAFLYDLAGPDMFTQLQISIIDVQVPNIGYFDELRRDDTFTSNPASGTLSIQGQAVLPAAHTYSLAYSQLLEAIGNTGDAADGSGTIHFTLSEVPEPAAFFSLALTALVLRRRCGRLCFGRRCTG
jgi:hypothetical protein